MQRAPIDLAALYRADNVFGPRGTTPHKTGYALIALGRMKDTPLRAEEPPARMTTASLSRRRGTKNGDTVQVLISNYQIPVRVHRAPQGAATSSPWARSFPGDLLPRRNVSYVDNRGYDLTIDGLEPGKSLHGRTLSNLRPERLVSCRYLDGDRPVYSLVRATAAARHRAVALKKR